MPWHLATTSVGDGALIFGVQCKGERIQIMPEPTLQDCLKEARRELSMRESAYKTWVINGMLEGSVAAHRLACQRRIVEIVREALELESLP